MNPLLGKISRRLLLYILLFSTVITIGLTAIQLYKDYEKDLAAMDVMLSQVEFSHLGPIRENVWRLNKNAIDLSLQGLLRVEDIVYLEIRSPDNQVYSSAGEQQTADTVTRRFPLIYQYKGSDIDLGEMVVVATLTNIYARLWDTFIAILVSQGIKTFLVSVFILYMVHALVIRHLMAMAGHFSSVAAQDGLPEFSLDRRPVRLWPSDELDQLVAAFNAMRKQLFSIYSRLKMNESVLKKAQRVALVGSWYWDMDSDRLEVSDELLNILGLDDESRVGLSIDDLMKLVGTADRLNLRRSLQPGRHEPLSVAMEHGITLGDGSKRFVRHQIQEWNDDALGDVGHGLIGTLQDITDQYLSTLELERLANYDSLTELPNRLLFHKHLESVIGQPEHMVMMAIIDLDGFKEVNDSLGHQSGDNLLKMLRPRLLGLLRPGDMVARLGGDEFGLILASVDSVEDGIHIIEQVRVAIQQPFALEEMQVQVDASIGVSVYPLHSSDPSCLMRYADIAMYQAKASKAGYALYESEHDPHSQRRLSLISDLRNALESGQLSLYYQPKVNLHSLKLIGLEALCRWVHPQHGFVMPNDFIPLIERSQIVKIFTLWAIERAMLDHIELKRRGHAIPVSVNISARNLRDPLFADSVAVILNRLGIKADALMLEITESAIMDDPKQALSTIRALDELGVALSIDDFGTGYSSLAYLKSLPVDELKIDRSFVRDMLNDPSDRIIVKSTIDLAHNLGLKVTAEGVENLESVRMLSAFDCENAQGYHFSPPMPLEGLYEWLQSKKCG